MEDHDIALMAHFMRRAGFGAQYDELEARGSEGLRSDGGRAAESRGKIPMAWTWT